ncbi:MAG: DUF5017 domain-containing protein, partial [Chitinophagaceae bacterium]
MLVAISLCIGSCKKEETAAEPDFDVAAGATAIHVGDTVRFSITGNPDIITFYSGLPGSDYDFIDKDRVYPATQSLSFISAKYAGNNADCASLKYSTDFNGVYDLASVRAATWTDISNMVHIPAINGSSAIFENSGEADIAGIFPSGAGKPVYFAWYFTTAANSSRTRFQIQQFQIKGNVPADPSLSGVRYDFGAFNFQMLPGEGFLTQSDPATLPRVTATAIIWDGVYANTSFKEGYAVSKPIYSFTELNLGHDKGTAIKSAYDPALKEYNFRYDKPGNYTVTFAGANVYGNNKKQV